MIKDDFYIEKTRVLEYNKEVKSDTFSYNLLVIYLKKIIFTSISVLISAIIFILTLSPNENYINTVKKTYLNPPTVIIDAGHGGIDGGAVSVDGSLEKDINLDISKYLQEYLILFGLKTVMVRETDASLEDAGLSTIREKKVSDIHNRMKIMEQTDNSIFVSIHQNKFQIEKYSGTQVFYAPKTASESSVLAQCIQDSVVNALQKENTRRIKECGTSVYLMYNAVKPAVLVECGFLSNEVEAKKLATTEYQKEIAFCIALGIQNYLSVRNE